MRAILLYIGILFFGISCHSASFHPQPGDLLFQLNESTPMTDAITAATGSGTLDFAHAAIAITPDSVIEASSDGGVRTTTLAAFLSASARVGNHPGVVVMRLRDTSGVASAVHHARSYLGQPYDYSYLPQNGRMYCSELVYESYLRSDAGHLFTAHPMRFRDNTGNLPEFWRDLFAKQGEVIPEDVPGTNPNDMCREEILEQVYRYF